MNKRMDEKTYYCNTFDEAGASEDLFRKVITMKHKDNYRKIRKTVRMRYAGAVAALVLTVLVSSNIVTYAATGSTWIEKVMVTVNGEEKEVDMTRYKDADGGDCYEMTVDEAGTKSISMSMSGESNICTGSDASDPEDEDVLPETAVTMREGRTYLEAGGQSVDITEDMKDGVCSGSFEADGKKYLYEITGTIEEHTINVTAAE